MKPDEKLIKGLGSKYYIAPEIVKKRPYDMKVDVFSATVVIYSLLIGRIPFPGKDFKQVKKLHKHYDISKDIQKEKEVSKEVKDFLLKGLTIN